MLGKHGVKEILTNHCIFSPDGGEDSTPRRKITHPQQVTAFLAPTEVKIQHHGAELRTLNKSLHF